MDDALFDAAPYAAAPEPAGKLSGDARRRQRQEQAIRGGFHPLGVALGQPIRLHPQAPPAGDNNAPGPRCGSCWYRRSIKGNSRSYPKCVYGVENHTDTAPGAAPRITHRVQATDWYPAECMSCHNEISAHGPQPKPADKKPKGRPDAAR